MEATRIVAEAGKILYSQGIEPALSVGDVEDKVHSPA